MPTITLSEGANEMLLNLTYFWGYGDLDEVLLPSRWVYQSVFWGLPFV